MARIGFLGLGAMGSRMATRLLAAGHEVTIWNRTAIAGRTLEKAGAHVASTPRASAKDADVVIAMVRDDDASRFVWLDKDIGALNGMRPDSVAVDSSTLTVEWVTELSREMVGRRVGFLDAPVLGSRPQAEAGQLIYLLGGAEETLTRARPILQAMGGAVHHVGANGSGATLKLIANELFAVQVGAFAEAIGFLKSSGLDVAKAVEILGNLPVSSPSAKGAAASMVAGNFSPMFPVELVEKDMGYAISSARSKGAQLPMAEAVRRVMESAIKRGFGPDNLTGIVRLYMSPPA